jgi:hypothetical protein
MEIPTLETERLRLVPPGLEHLRAYHACVSDPEFIRHLAMVDHWHRVAEKLGARHERNIDFLGGESRVIYIRRSVYLSYNFNSIPIVQSL